MGFGSCIFIDLICCGGFRFVLGNVVWDWDWVWRGGVVEVREFLGLKLFWVVAGVFRFVLVFFWWLWMERL